MIADQSEWGHIRVTGSDRARFLQGMCSADIEALAPGDWTRAVILSVKGRVVSIIEVACREDDLLITCQADIADKTLSVLDKHAIMDEVAFEHVAQPMHRIWDTPSAVWDAPPIFAPPPGPAASAEQLEIRRIEAGMPRYGVDVSEDYFPFESLLDRHVNHKKGCYLGQEPVSRVHHRGGAQKRLRGLRIEGDEPVPAGAAIVHAERAKAGTVSSAARSPEFGSIALGYIHRSVFAPGNEVSVDGRRATIVALPFGAERDEGAGQASS
ncbi:YgfZ/GcvT domain-containing protein [Haliangium ochraceum]|uniref:Folate-binding protein YgfZ n=1 Tax=Haliangium ochraceum (strain DSM 14365 / JCM 11303 / SMP-2) TaxID=502025 RepID=D0LY43_HALO1|nr:glycine cleavage T C-terminal barrel domain-containing protein [Haliangium ochraceum]ACY16193.1 folate-binding protein YgfZ [Haliangium ochraceum DSM 14365]